MPTSRRERRPALRGLVGSPPPPAPPGSVDWEAKAQGGRASSHTPSSVGTPEEDRLAAGAAAAAAAAAFCPARRVRGRPMPLAALKMPLPLPAPPRSSPSPLPPPCAAAAAAAAEASLRSLKTMYLCTRALAGCDWLLPLLLLLLPLNLPPPPACGVASTTVTSPRSTATYQEVALTSTPTSTELTSSLLMGRSQPVEARLPARAPGLGLNLLPPPPPPPPPRLLRRALEASRLPWKPPWVLRAGVLLLCSSSVSVTLLTLTSSLSQR